MEPNTPGKPGQRIQKWLLAGEIIAAQAMSLTENQVARQLGVSYMTYRKYALMYGLCGRVSNRGGKGTKKPIQNEDSGKYPLNRILEGKFPNYHTSRLKKRMLRAGKLPKKCNKCGFSETRLNDGSAPLILNYKDGNEKNKKFENLEMLCYNCYYLNVNTPKGRKKAFMIDLSYDDSSGGAACPPSNNTPTTLP